MEIQEKVKKFCEEHNLTGSAEIRMLDLVSEIGEVAKEIIKTTDYGKKEAEYRKEIESELGDALFSLMTVANTYDVDMEAALNKVLEKYKM